MTARKKLLLGAAVVLAVLVAGGAVFALTRPPQDVSNPDVAFEDEPTVTPVPDGDPRGAREGLQEGRPAAELRLGAPTATPRTGASSCPPRSCCARRSGASGATPGSILLEFPPVMAEGKLFLLKNNGALHAIDKRTGKAVWKRKLGVLAAASPAYGNGRIFVHAALARQEQAGRGLRARRQDGQDPLEAAAAVAQRVLAALRQRPHLPRLRERHGLLAARRRRRRALEVQGLGRGQVRARAGRRQALLRRLLGPRLRDPPDRRRRGLEHRDQGRRASGCSSGTFYSTPAVAYGRVYIGNTDGRMYSFSSANGKLAWTKGTGSYVYSSPAVAPGAGRRADGLLRLLRRHASTRSTRATARCAGRTATAARSPAARP